MSDKTGPQPTNITEDTVNGVRYDSCFIEPMSYIILNNLDFFQGNVLKYLTRHNRKGGKGKDDLGKALHYMLLLCEKEGVDVKVLLPKLKDFQSYTDIGEVDCDR